ncbi:MAG TPA: helix-turn-helix domain-containing protein, partial [Acidimicrobiia bacterium]
MTTGQPHADGGQIMSFEALGFVTGHLFVKGCTLSPVQRLTLISVAAATDPHGEGAFPGLAYLEETTGASRKTVQRSLADLAARGLLEDTGDRRGQTGRVVVWRMLLPAGTAKAAWPKHHQWRHRDLISAEPAESSMASPVPDSPAANEVTVTPLNED